MKVFIDCGFHHGEGLTWFVDHLKIDNSWIVMCFEPNQECDGKARARQLFPDLNIMFLERAVWTHNLLEEFLRENHLRSNSGSPHDNRSALDGWGSQLARVNGKFPGLTDPISVLCIDFAAVIRGIVLPSLECFYIKMDIEGSEFTVLRDVLKRVPECLSKIDKMWIEFHHRWIPGESEETKNQLVRALSKFTEVEEWH